MKTFPKPITDRELLDFMLLYAKHYLASGGPTSRLEEGLSRVGERCAKRTEVFATPTGVFVTICDILGDSEPKTALLRIRETGTNLGRLCRLEQIFSDFLDGKITLHTALEVLRNRAIVREFYKPSQTALAAFVAGTVISFSSYQHFTAALISGFITALVWFLTAVVLKRQFSNPIFSDFLGAFFTLVLAAVAHAFVAPLSIEAYALGGIVLLVPGLALTTAISELAEQNLVSGTAKFMQATLALLALGLAYLLFQQLSFSMALREVLQPAVVRSSSLWIYAASVVVNIFCFGVIFKVPPKSLIWSTFTGLMGWLCLQALVDTRAAAAGPYLASVMVGVVSLGLGRVFSLPSQLYSVPGIVAMLPGMLALNSFRYFASGDENSGIAFTFKVAITAVSIVFGLMTARMPFVMGSRYHWNWTKRFRRFRW